MQEVGVTVTSGVVRRSTTDGSRFYLRRAVEHRVRSNEGGGNSIEGVGIIDGVRVTIVCVVCGQWT